MDFSTVMQLIQTASIVLAIIVALGTIRGRGDDKAVMLTEMRKDIEHIKKAVECLPEQTEGLVELNASCKSAHKRMDDHLKYDHGK